MIEVGAGSRTDDDYKVRFYLDNEVVFLKYMNNTYDPLTGITAFIIPPFSTFKLTLQNQSTATANTWSANVTAKVGMAPRVGNLVE